MKRLICWLLGHPAGVREQLRLHESEALLELIGDYPEAPNVVEPDWITWWTGTRCIRCAEPYRL